MSENYINFIFIAINSTLTHKIYIFWFIVRLVSCNNQVIQKRCQLQQS